MSLTLTHPSTLGHRRAYRGIVDVRDRRAHDTLHPLPLLPHSFPQTLSILLSPSHFLHFLPASFPPSPVQSPPLFCSPSLLRTLFAPPPPPPPSPSPTIALPLATPSPSPTNLFSVFYSNTPAYSTPFAYCTFYPEPRLAWSHCGSEVDLYKSLPLRTEPCKPPHWPGQCTGQPQRLGSSDSSDRSPAGSHSNTGGVTRHAIDHVTRSRSLQGVQTKPWPGGGSGGGLIRNVSGKRSKGMCGAFFSSTRPSH